LCICSPAGTSEGCSDNVNKDMCSRIFKSAPGELQKSPYGRGNSSAEGRIKNREKKAAWASLLQSLYQPKRLQAVRWGRQRGVSIILAVTWRKREGGKNRKKTGLSRRVKKSPEKKESHVHEGNLGRGEKLCRKIASHNFESDK